MLIVEFAGIVRFWVGKFVVFEGSEIVTFAI